MAVLLKKFKARFNDKTYEPGETIEGLTEEDEASLVSLGYAEYVENLGNDSEYKDDSQTSEEDDDREVSEADQHTDGDSSDNPEEINITLDIEDYVESANTKPSKNKKSSRK